MAKRRLGVGFIGSGFNTRFHMQAWQGVRDADVLGVWSPNQANAASAAALARKLDVGRARAFNSIAAMVADPAIDAIWLCGPNHARLANVEEIADTVLRGRGELVGLACEKPLARTVKEAKQVTSLVKRAGLKHGYLENQLFARRWSTAGRSSGAAVPPPPDGPTWPGLPRSTAAPICPGSGAASSRAAASSTT